MHAHVITRMLAILIVCQAKKRRRPRQRPLDGRRPLTKTSRARLRQDEPRKRERRRGILLEEEEERRAILAKEEERKRKGRRRLWIWTSGNKK